MIDWMEAGSREASGRTCGAVMTEGGGGGKRRLSLIVLVLGPEVEEEEEAAAMVRTGVRVRMVAVRREEDCMSLLSDVLEEGESDTAVSLVLLLPGLCPLACGFVFLFIL